MTVDLRAGKQEKSSMGQGSGSTSSSDRLSNFSSSEGTNSNVSSGDDMKTDPHKDAKDDKAKEGADAKKPLTLGHGVDLEIPEDLCCAPSTSTLPGGGGTSFLPKLLFCH